MKIQNIEDLRTHAIETLENLRAGKIEIDEAGTTSKLYENILSSVKLELEYAKILDKNPKIKFINSKLEDKPYMELPGMKVKQLKNLKDK